MRDGRLPPGHGQRRASARTTSPARTSACSFHERHFALFEGCFWETYGTTRPTYVRTREGVPWSPPTAAGSCHERATSRAPAAAAAPPQARRRIERLFARAGAWSSSTSSSGRPTWAPRAAGCKRHSQYNHFVYLAEGWLDGRLSLKGQPPNENDWARVDVLTLRDGREVRGKFGSTGATDRFYFTAAAARPSAPRRSRRATAIRYVSFPPFPAVPMVPFVAVCRAALQRRAVHGGLGGASTRCCCSCCCATWRARGLLAAHAPRRPVADGAAGGRARSTTTARCWGRSGTPPTSSPSPSSSSTPGPRWTRAVPGWPGCCWARASPPARRWATCSRCSSGRRCACRAAGRRCGSVEPPGARLAAAAARASRCRRRPSWRCCSSHNYARFENPFEFGHEFLNIAWKERIERWGLFNYHFLSRNLAGALVLLPRILAHARSCSSAGTACRCS